MDRLFDWLSRPSWGLALVLLVMFGLSFACFYTMTYSMATDGRFWL